MITKKDTNMTKSKKQPSLIHETDFRSQTSISAGKDMVQV